MLWGHRRWRFVLIVAGLWPLTPNAGTSGPDAAGLILVDSVESDGPPQGWVDMTDADDMAPGVVDLPFAFSMGTSSHEVATISSEGWLVFDGEPAGCPGAARVRTRCRRTKPQGRRSSWLH